jgi:hypothetical protein
MRSSCRTWVAVAAGLALLPQVAVASDVEDELRLMDERLSQLEDRLQVTTDELETARQQVATQQEVIEEAGLSGESGARSGLSAFLEATDFGAWVATSYTYNLANKDNDGLIGQNTVLPFHPDSNAFQVDQVWFEIDKGVNEESRGGLHVDLLFGKTASILGGSGGSLFQGLGTGGNDGVEVFSAYVSYLAPLLDGIRIDAGELPTLLGAEVVQAPSNFNITRGLVWGLQPVTHTGVIASTTLESDFSVSVGFVNDGFQDFNADDDNNKAVTVQLAYGGEAYSGAISWIHGSESFDDALNLTNDEKDKSGVLDVVLTSNPSENLSLWLNLDWAYARDHTIAGVDQKGSDGFGVALAGRLQVLDTTGVALRGEYLREDDNFLGLGGDSTLWSVTATVDHALTDHLTARLEGRFDWARLSGGSDDFYIDSSGGSTRTDQQVLLAELIYAF